MDPSRWRRSNALFEAARQLAAAARGDYLAAQCADDAELREHVAGLLDQYDRAASFEARLDGAVGELTGDLARDAADDPEQIGEYRVLRSIGAGGMGEVWLCERDDGAIRQRVAVKVLKRGMDTAQVLRRFRTERRILAALEHRGTARILGGGQTDDGRPYFAMEYVQGEAVDRHCDAARMDVDARLELFCRICDVVSFAHRNLVVHRDLKPSNVLVTADGEVKLLDFGIAKVLGDSAADDGLAMPSAVTLTGMQPMTPAYAAPEQVRGGVVSTAVDVYSLGVLLYELLCGRRPYELAGLPSTEIERQVCEVEPERPSVACARVADDAAPGARSPAAVAAARGTQPARLRRRLAGDLDTICMMALRKEPERRYATVDQLREDVRRTLAGLPVRARPDTFGYRFTKFARRNVWPLAAGAAVAVLVVGLVAFYTRRLADERDRARVEADKYEQAARFLQDLFAAPDVLDLEATDAPRGLDTTAGQLLERGAARVRADLRDQPEVQAAMLRILGSTYRSLGEYERAGGMLEDALAVLEALHGRASMPVIELLDELAGAYCDAGQYDRAEPLFRESLDGLRPLVASRSIGIGVTANDLGLLLWHQGRNAEAEPLVREAVAVFRHVYGAGHPFVAVASGNLARILRDLGRIDEAEALVLEVLESKRRALGDRDASVANTLGQLGMLLLENRDDPVAAERRFREALSIREARLGPQHPYVAVSLHEIGRALHARGQREQAEALFRRALELRREVLPAAHPHLALSLVGLAELLLDTGRAGEAAPLLREARQIRAAAFAPGHHFVAEAENLLGCCLVDLGEPGGAAAMERGLRGLEAALGVDDPRTRRARARAEARR